MRTSITFLSFCFDVGCFFNSSDFTASIEEELAEEIHPNTPEEELQGLVMSGYHFNRIYPERKFYRVIDGQTDTIMQRNCIILSPSFKREDWNKGKMYFVSEDQLLHHWMCNGRTSCIMRQVHIPKDANVKIERRKFGTDRFVLHNYYTLSRTDNRIKLISMKNKAISTKLTTFYLYISIFGNVNLTHDTRSSSIAHPMV